FAIGAAMIYDPNGKRPLIDFALGVMSFAYSGMLAVFLTALLTSRGNGASVLAALIVGVVVVTILQDPIWIRITTRLLGSPHPIASFWTLPIGTLIAFCVCVSGRTRLLQGRP